MPRASDPSGTPKPGLHPNRLTPTGLVARSGIVFSLKTSGNMWGCSRLLFCKLSDHGQTGTPFAGR
jgi:hypothetical protein